MFLAKVIQVHTIIQLLSSLKDPTDNCAAEPLTTAEETHLKGKPAFSGTISKAVENTQWFIKKDNSSGND